MDELYERILNLSLEASKYQMLIDTILDNTRINGYDHSLEFNSRGEDKILDLVKIFAPDEVKNRLEELTKEAENNG